MEASKTAVTAVSEKQRASLQKLAEQADGLHSKIESGMGFKNMMKSDIVAVAWNARLMLKPENDEPKKEHDEEYAKRLEMWVSIYGGDAASVEQKIKVMDAVLSFWEGQTGPDIRNDVKPLQ